MQCLQSFSTVTTNGTDIFLLENENYIPFFSYNILSGKFPAKFIHSPIDFRKISWTDMQTITPSFVCHQEDTNIPHIGFFDFSLHDQMLIGINFCVFLVLATIFCTIFYLIGMCAEKLFRFVFHFGRKFFQI